MSTLAAEHPLTIKRDPIGPLLAARDPALSWAVEKDILGRQLQPQSLWELPRVLQAQRRQNPSGSWTYHGGRGNLRSREDYDQLATYEQLLILVSQYRLDRRHPMIARAAENLLGHQSEEGDIRGIYGTQYTPNYTADILRLLIEVGYAEDWRVIKGLNWLLGLRQSDGGWALPMRTASDYVLTRALNLPRPLQPNRSKPSSHLITGIVLRVFAAHPSFRNRSETRQAALLLASRFFTADRYPDRKASAYWGKLSFPFRWTDIVSSLDSIGLIGVSGEQALVAKGVRWLINHQHKGGLWRAGYAHSPDPLLDYWVTFGAARALKRFLAGSSTRARRLAAS